MISFFASEETQAEGIAALGLDLKAFIIQLITFLLVYFVLRKYVFSRIIDLLEKRQQTIDEGMKLTTQMQTEKDKLDQEVTKIRRQARQDADQILFKAHEQAGLIAKKSEDASARKADAIIADAHKRIEEDANKARRQLENEVVNLVVDATEKVAKEKIDAKKDARLISNALRGSS